MFIDVLLETLLVVLHDLSAFRHDLLKCWDTLIVNTWMHIKEDIDNSLFLDALSELLLLS
jgi:hypothetical protein